MWSDYLFFFFFVFLFFLLGKLPLFAFSCEVIIFFLFFCLFFFFFSVNFLYLHFSVKWSSSHHIFSIEITRYLYLWPHIKYANRGLANILTFVFFVFCFFLSADLPILSFIFFPYNLLCCGIILYPRNLRKPSHKFSSEAILGVFRTLQTRPLSFLHLAVIYEWFTSAMIIMTFMSSKNFKILRGLIIHHISCDCFISTLGTILPNSLTNCRCEETWQVKSSCKTTRN